MIKGEGLRFCASDELRVTEGPNGRKRIEGYAVVYNSMSNDLGGFKEKILPGAFTDALAANEEVLALAHHDPKLILGRRSAGTLTLRDDAKGLYATIDPPNSSLGNDMIESVGRKDIKGMSFRFPRGAKDAWSMDSEGQSVRTISKAGLMEVTLTGIPAYDATTANVRGGWNDDDHELRAYYAKQIAAVNPSKMADAEKRLKVMEAEVRCSGDYYGSDPDPADACTRVLYNCRNVFDAATAAIDALGDLDEMDDDVPGAASDAADEADKAIARLTKFSEMCRAIKAA